MNTIWIILKKETTDNLRDRRSVVNILFSVLLNPVLFIAIFAFVGRSFSEKAEQPLQLAVQGAANAPSLIAFLAQNNVEVTEAPADVEEALQAGDVEVVLTIPDDYGRAFISGQPAAIQLTFDESNQAAGVSVTRARRLLEAYSAQIGSLRLLARGVSPAIVRALVVEEVDVAAAGRGASSLSFLPTVMLVAAFYGGFYLAVDLTAGERERNSLEPLLINPVQRWHFVAGKFIATFLFTLFATVAATLSYIGLLLIPQVQAFTRLRVEFSLEAIATVLFLILPVVFLAVAVEFLIASYARSVKEAQTYISYVSLAGFLPAMFLSILPMKSQTWMLLIPSVSQTLLISSVTRGETLDMGRVLLASVVTIVLAIVPLLVAIRLYNRERIVLGRS